MNLKGLGPWLSPDHMNSYGLVASVAPKPVHSYGFDGRLFRRHQQCSNQGATGAPKGRIQQWIQHLDQIFVLGDRLHNLGSELLDPLCDFSFVVLIRILDRPLWDFARYEHGGVPVFGGRPHLPYVTQ